MNGSYRGRLAPSPTGYLHLGHARTFWIAQQRAEATGGALILRNDDLDRAHREPAFFHGPLVTDENGARLAKRLDSLSLRTLRKAGRTPEELRGE